MKHVEKVLEANGGEFVVGDGLTWADINLAVTMSHVNDLLEVDWKPTAEKLSEHQERIYSLPNITKWIESRPENKM